MPPQKTQTGLVAKYGGRLQKAFEAHKEDETEYRNFSDLPAGIDMGVAQLRECKFDQYKTGDMQGEYYFYAAGVCIIPKKHDGIPIEGGRTSIMEPLCDTPKRKRATTDDHVWWVLNELRKLGLDTANLTVADLETAASALREAQPYFRFRTWKGAASEDYPDPRTNHDWMGICEPPDESAEEPATKDDTALEKPPTRPAARAPQRPGTGNGRAVQAPAAKTPVSPGRGQPSAKGPGRKAPPPEPEPEPEANSFDDQGDIYALAQRADDGDLDAGDELKGLALAAGIDEDMITAAENWRLVAEMLDNNPADGATEGESTPETEVEEAPVPVVPKKGNVYLYSPVDPKTKRPGKEVECMVTVVDGKGKTVTLKNLDNNKEYPKVPWDKLKEVA